MANENIVIEYNQVEALTIDVAKEIILDEVPDGRPIHIPIADYENPGIASFDKRYFIIDNKGRVSSVAHNPTEIFIRYSAYSDGTDFTDTWDSGKYYIGIAIGKVLPTNKADYSWSKFIGTGISVGDVTTIIGEASTDASVLVTPRPVDPLIPSGDLYLDFTFTIPKSVKSVSEVMPDENGDVPLIVFQLPENPQEGQIWFDTLNEEIPVQTMGYTVTEEEAPVVEETSGYTVMEEPETQLIVENTFANEVYNEYVFTNNEIIENSYKE